MPPKPSDAHFDLKFDDGLISGTGFSITPTKLDNPLFPLNSDRFDIITTHLFKRLKRINHKVKDMKQIRASVMTYWLSQYNIREVQYMAGHRYISYTERYVQDDLESLHELIETLHPIG